MKVNYFFRKKNVAYSIENVFGTIILNIPESVQKKIHYMPQHGGRVLTILKNILFTYKYRDKKAINHITGDIQYCIIGLIGCKTVLTIHDLVFVNNAKNPLDKFLKWLLWVYIPVKLASEVVCISESTKRELLNYVKVKNVKVIYNPFANHFIRSPKDFSKTPVVLHIGTGWNKNLENVILSLAGLNYFLRIIGSISIHQKSLLQKSNVSYSQSSNLKDEEILEEYKKSDIVSFPSIYEGFGMPIIEAQAVGRIVLTSNIEPMMEIAADSAHYVNPNDLDSIRDGFEKIVNNKSYREELIKLGFINVNRFTPNTISSQYIDLYKSLNIMPKYK